MSLIESLTSFFAPDDCLNCSREGSLLCKNCLPLLPALPGSCYGCHKKCPGLAACVDCLAYSGLDSLRAAAGYTGISKQLVAQLKFSGNQSAARLMATAIMDSRPWLPRDALLTNVPATAQHIRQRGYDQSVLIVKHLSRQSGCPRARLLARSGSHHQLGSDRTARLTQLSTALRITNAAKIAGRHIIIIDDVLTTGSSVSAAVQLLKAAGAARVDGLVFAQA